MQKTITQQLSIQHTGTGFGIIKQIETYLMDDNSKTRITRDIFHKNKFCAKPGEKVWVDDFPTLKEAQDAGMDPKYMYDQLVFYTVRNQNVAGKEAAAKK
ncbi:hypothetical protein FACS189421_03010 [Bacteroidia bacterium]|nr:hypothetical protein FACS189421_03010 [Bacteroidia bacterium]